jgi:hypothetical protein
MTYREGMSIMMLIQYSYLLWPTYGFKKRPYYGCVHNSHSIEISGECESLFTQATCSYSGLRPEGFESYRAHHYLFKK